MIITVIFIVVVKLVCDIVFVKTLAMTSFYCKNMDNKSIINNFSASDRLLIPDDFRISCEKKQITIRLEQRSNKGPLGNKSDAFPISAHACKNGSLNFSEGN